MSEQPLVSVITVTYNAKSYLEQTIQSVFAQTYPHIEYIIIDGASTDGTLDIIKRHEKKIAFWVSEKDNGIYDAMNKGIRAANGELIGIINASDYYEPDTISEVVKAYLQHQDVGIFHGNINMLNMDGSFFKHKTAAKDVNNLCDGFSLFHPTFFVTKTTYNQVGAYDTNFKIAADYDFALRCANANVKFFHIDKVISNFRVGGISSADRKKCLEESKKVLINNHIDEEKADSIYKKWKKHDRKNHIYRTVYESLRTFLPNKLMSRIALKFSVK